MTATRDHRHTWELIPWYVNQTLEGEERDQVEAHLASCARCRAEVEACRELVAAGGRPEELAPAPHPAQLDRLVERIRRQERGRSADRSHGRQPSWHGERIGSPTARLLGQWRAAPAALRRAAAVVALLAAGVAGWLLHPAAPPVGDAGGGAVPDAEYRTLSAPAELPRGPVLRVVFAPSTPEEEIRRLLLAVGGEIVAGPSRLGVYGVRTGSPADGADPPAVVVDHLRRQPAVRFAEVVEPTTDQAPAPDPGPGPDRGAAERPHGAAGRIPR